MATRRSAIGMAAAGCALMLPSIGRVAAQSKYPDKSIKLIVPYAPVTPVDTMARLMARQLSARFGQAVVVSTFGPGIAAAAAPDGYTLLFDSALFALNPVLNPSSALDLRKAFAPVATVAVLPYVFVVNNEVPAKTIAEFLAYARADPSKISYSANPGTPAHVLSTLFKTEARLDAVYVPSGSSEWLNDLLRSRTQFIIDGLDMLLPWIRSGQVHPLAIASAGRWPTLPEVPTLVESGFPDFVIDDWTGLFAPAGTPQPILDLLNTAVNDILKSPQFSENLAKLSGIAKIGTAEEFNAFLDEQSQRWAAIVKAAGAGIN